jgi:hypothetical protein
VQSSKHVYTTQDAVEFIAQVYDANYQPVDDAQVEVHVQRGSETSLIVFYALGSGQYQGEYKFTATVVANGAAIGSDQGTFSVGGLNAEFLETRMNKSLLQQIATQTGGRYYDGDNVSSLAQDVTTMPHFKSRDISTSATIEIWNSRWMLVLVVFIFSLEWFLRKRNGML